MRDSGLSFLVALLLIAGGCSREPRSRREAASAASSHEKHARVPSPSPDIAPPGPPVAPAGNEGGEGPQGTARHGVIILVDTLRADAVEKARTPNLDALATRSAVFERAWAPSTWTVPSVISLFTGAFVRTHGWDLPVGELESAPVPDMPTLAEVLQEQGFETRGLYANGYLGHELGFSRGFDEWYRTSDRRMAGEVRERVQQWQEQDADTPPEESPRRFLYVHLLGPHSGLSPSEQARRRWELSDRWFEEGKGLLIGRAKRGREEGVRDAYRRAYHAEVEDADTRIGEILDALGPYRDRSVVMLLADHGEELGERDRFGHGWSVAESLTHVPFMVSGPGIEPGSRALGTLAEATDLFTDSLGIDYPWPVQSPWDGPLAAERHGRFAVLASGRYKGTWFNGDLRVRDLVASSTDGGSGNGTKVAEEVREQVRAARQEWLERVPAGSAASASDTVELDPKTVNAIRALGYIE